MIPTPNRRRTIAGRKEAVTEAKAPGSGGQCSVIDIHHIIGKKDCGTGRTAGNHTQNCCRCLLLAFAEPFLSASITQLVSAGEDSTAREIIAALTSEINAA